MSRTFIPGTTRTIDFVSRHPTTGLPSALGGSPAVTGYSTAGGTTEATTGLTLTADYDGKTGYNRLTVALTDATAFPIDNDFSVRFTAGTVGGSDITGELAAEFNTYCRAQGVANAGILVGANTDDENFQLPTGRRAGVEVGMLLFVPGVGTRRIATYDSGTGQGTVSPAFASDVSDLLAIVLATAPVEPLGSADTDGTFMDTELGRVSMAVAADAGNSNTTFKVSVDAGADVRSGVIRQTSGSQLGESRRVKWTGTQVTVLSHPDMDAADLGFSATPANGVTLMFEPL